MMDHRDAVPNCDCNSIIRGGILHTESMIPRYSGYCVIRTCVITELNLSILNR